MQRYLLPTGLFVFTGLVLYLLATGSKWLVFPLLEDPFVPLGNVLTWLGLAALPLAMLNLGNPRHRGKAMGTGYRNVFRPALMVNLVLAALWFPLSRLLAGNWNTSFKNGSLVSDLWWGYTYGLPLMSLGIGLLWLSWNLFTTLTHRAG